MPYIVVNLRHNILYRYSKGARIISHGASVILYQFLRFPYNIDGLVLGKTGRYLRTVIVRMAVSWLPSAAFAATVHR